MVRDREAYRAINPAVAPAAVTWSREPSSLSLSPRLLLDMHPAVSGGDLSDWIR